MRTFMNWLGVFGVVLNLLVGNFAIASMLATLVILTWSI